MPLRTHCRVFGRALAGALLFATCAIGPAIPQPSPNHSQHFTPPVHPTPPGVPVGPRRAHDHDLLAPRQRFPYPTMPPGVPVGPRRAHDHDLLAPRQRFSYPTMPPGVPVGPRRAHDHDLRRVPGAPRARPRPDHADAAVCKDLLRHQDPRQAERGGGQGGGGESGRVCPRAKCILGILGRTATMCCQAVSTEPNLGLLLPSHGRSHEPCMNPVLV